MVHRWIQHVRDYAEKNNISYACAVSRAKETYVKESKTEKKEREKKEQEKSFNQSYKNTLKLIEKAEKENDKNSIMFYKRMFNQKPPKFKNYFKNKDIDLYDFLTDEIKPPKEKTKKKSNLEIKQEYINKDLNEQFEKDFKKTFDSDEFKKLPLELQKLRFESIPPKYQEYIKENNRALYNLISK